MNAQDVGAAIHALIMEHGLVIGDVILTMAVEDSVFVTTGEVELQFGDGSIFTVRVRGDD